MIDKSIYKEFYDYLTEGANHIIQNNRDNLEIYIRESIDINKSANILKKHRKENDNFIVSPKTFLSLSLIDDLPKNIDLRFVPEFKLDGVIFKYHRTSNIITSIKVPYSEKINNFLKLQLSPNSDIEMSRSGKYANNIINNLQLFDKIFRDELDTYRNSVFRQIKNILHNTSPFFDSIVSCVINKDKTFKSRITRHYVKSIQCQIEFCSQFNNLMSGKLKKTDPSIIYKEIYIIILNNLFPKLSTSEIDKIFTISLNVDEIINYSTIKEIVNTKHKIHPLLCDALDNCKNEFKLINKNKERFLNYTECFSNKFIAQILDDSEHDNIISHNFFNLIIFINRCREDIIYNMKRELPSFNHEQISNTCRNIVCLHELKLWMDNNSNLNLKDLHPKFHEYLKQSKILNKLDGKIKLEYNFDNKLIEKFLKHLYPKTPLYKIKGEDDLVPKIIRKKREYEYDANGNIMYSDKFITLKNNNNFIVEFCKEEYAWNSDNSNNNLFEITSSIVLSNVNNIGCKNLLSYLFKEQVDNVFFQNVQYILFHENIIVVSKDGELSSLYPSDGYKQFVLNKLGSSLMETSRDNDYDNIQLNRFKKILDDVLIENTKKYLDNRSGDDFIDNVSSVFNIKFTNTAEYINLNKEKEQHELSWGSFSEIEQEYFINFLKEFSFIFPEKINEIHLSNILPKNRTEIPINEKELFFYIEKQKDDRDMYEKYFITQEDLILLSRSSRFYTTILVDRAFSVIFNREILNNEIIYAEFKNVIGQKNIEIAKRYFNVRGKSITDHRLFRKIFIKNSSLFIQNKKEQLSIQIIDFMSNIFRQKKQLY